MKSNTIFRKLCLIAVIVTTTLLHTQISQATIVAFKFEGPVVGEGTFITGKVIYDTVSSGIDVRGPQDKGDRFAYTDAIKSISFMTEKVSKSYTAGSFTEGIVQLYNNYEICLLPSPTGCKNYKPERDRLVFNIKGFVDGPFSSSLFLGLFGKDASFRVDGNLPDLPETIPTEGYYRTDFFWDIVGNDVDIGIASNSIQIIPEPGTILLICAGLIIILATSRLQSHHYIAPPMTET